MLFNDFQSDRMKTNKKVSNMSSSIFKGFQKKILIEFLKKLSMDFFYFNVFLFCLTYTVTWSWFYLMTQDVLLKLKNWFNLRINDKI